MKLTTLFQKILPAIFIVMAFTGYAQQEYTLTTSAANISSAKALIDLPGLSGNTNAIIIATPQGNTKTLNPHPTGAWYYSGKWNIFNCDFAPMPVGLTYKVQYFLTPGANQFLHLVTQGSLGAEGSYIDNPVLNNKPNAQFGIFPNHSPETRAGSWLNPHEAKAAYNTSSGKWYITNINGQLMQKGCAYNIVVSSASGSTGTDPVTNPPVGSCNCPASLPPNGQATGDLAGMYPNPMVTKLLNRPLSNTPPTIGQVLKWNGTEWVPSNETGNAGNATTYTAGLGLSLNGTQFNTLSSTAMWNASQLVGRDVMTTAPTVGQVLKWGGGSWAPADDNVGTVGTGNSWNSNGNNISNSNTGNVGIGNSNPAYLLDVNNRMRIRSGGNNSTTAGLWLNNNANTEAAFIGMEDDTHVGFYGKDGAGWKFSMNTQTGALKINGSEGTAGQVLTSNGAGSTPTWNQSSAGAATVAKPSVIYYSQSASADLKYTYDREKTIPGLDNQFFTLPQSSRVVFNTSVPLSTGGSGLSVGSFAWMEVTVEILNASNVVVARASSQAAIGELVTQNVNSVGIGILPAGTYHTHVKFFRSFNTVLQVGALLNAYNNCQLIIEIFPD
jgi:hypothetical protein